MLRPIPLLAPLALGLLLSASSLQAGVLVPSESTLTIRIGSLPPIVITGQGDSSGASLSGGELLLNPGVWSTASLTVQASSGTAIFTGAPVLTRLSALSLVNRSGTFTSVVTPSWSGWAGPGGLDGSLVLHVAGIATPVSVGQSAGTWVNLTSTSFIAATSGTSITGIQTRRIRLPNRPGAPTGAAITLKPTAGEVVETVTTAPLKSSVTLFESTIALTSRGEEGTITLVAPMRILVSPGVYVPGYIAKKLRFVPEPGSLGLGIAAVVTLALIGRARQRD